MSATATVRVMSPEEIASRAGGQTPYFHWPERGALFAEREMRLRQLAAGHAMQDFLLFMAELARAQHARLLSFPSVPLPDAAALDRAAQLGVPPLAATDWPRDPAWRATLRALVGELRGRTPAGTHEVLDRVAAASDEWLEAQADALLDGTMQGLDLGAASLVAAALQVYWTHLVLAVQQAHGPKGQPFGRLDDESLCPACGSRPVASLTRHAGEASGQRYLHCSLCSLQWYRGRITCTHCGSGRSVAYQSLDLAEAAPEDAPARAAQAAVQAETCDDCHHYLKILHTERDPFVDPVADDLATVTLDLLVADAGLHRHGVNLMLLFGDAEEPERGRS